ncbi:MAG: TlpA disulfide reductase family protein [Actinomycetota bacterium]|jgi:cytochrome c biogenesis protein CcmG, thiol:disulfide interchange protein DsbE
MATTKPKPKKKGAVAAARKKQPPWLWIGVAAVVLVLAVAAIASGGGSDGDKTAEGVEQTRPVNVTGSALEKFRPGGADPAIGKTIPEVRGQSFDGTPVEISNDGRAKLILFVAHWCPHCQKEIPLLADWLKSNQLPSGVDLYTVSTGVSSNNPNYPPSEWLEEEGWTAKTLADSGDQEAADAFGLGSYPYFVAVDGSGKVVARTSGELSTDEFEALAKKAVGNQ